MDEIVTYKIILQELIDYEDKGLEVLDIGILIGDSIEGVMAKLRNRYAPHSEVGISEDPDIVSCLTWETTVEYDENADSYESTMSAYLIKEVRVDLDITKHV